MISRNKSPSIRGMARLYHRKEDRIGPDGILARHNYKLTAAGRKQLVIEVSQFERVMGAIARVIQTA
jgi:hypothetical protein